MKIEKELRHYYKSLNVPEINKIIPDIEDKTNKKQRIHTAIYIGIPVLIATLVIVLIVIFKVGDYAPGDGENGKQTMTDGTSAESSGVQQLEGDIIDPKIMLYPQCVYAELIIHGKYVADSEFDIDGETYHMYEISVNKTYKGDDKDGCIVRVIGKKQLSYSYYTYEDDMDRLKHQTIAFFDQVSVGDEVFLFLNKSSIKPEEYEEDFYCNICYVYYVDDKGDMFRVHDPYNYPDDVYIEQMERVRKQTKNKRYYPTDVNVYKDMEEILAYTSQFDRWLPEE